MEDVHILRLDTACGINHQDADIRILDGPDGTHHAIELQIFRHLVLTTDTCGVHKIEIETKLIITGIDGITCRTGNLGDDITFLTDKGIDNTGLTGIRTTHHRKTGDTFLKLVCVLLRQHLQHLVKQIARTTARRGTDTVRIAKTKVIKLVLVIEMLVVISLVCYEENRQFGTTQNLGHVHVPACHTVLDITDEKNQIGLFRGNDHLLTDFLLEYIIRIDDPAACIHDGELTAIPVALAILAVAGGTSFIADNRLTTFRKSVEKRRLAHIGTSYNCY